MADYVSEQHTLYDDNGRFYQLNYRMAPFAGGSDHLIFNDQHFSIPSVMFGHEDLFHHSSADSIDKVDPLECKSVAIIVGSAAFGLSIADTQFLRELLHFVFLEGVEDMIQHEIHLDKGELTRNQKVRQLKLLARLIVKRMESVLELKPEDVFQEKLSYFSQAIKAHFLRTERQLKIETEEQEKNEIAETKIKRNYIGPIPFKRLMRTDRSDEDDKTFLALSKEYWGGIPLELLNLASGSFTIEEIFLLLKIQYPNIDFNRMISLIKLFKKEKILEA